MRFIHPAAWAGLILNCGLMFFVYSVLQSAPSGALTEQQAVIVKGVLAARPWVFGFLLAQAVSLGLIGMRIRLGVLIGCVAGSLLLPAGFVFIIGCMLSHYAAKYDRLPSAPRGFAGARAVFRSGLAKRMRAFCGVTGVIALFLVLSGLENFGTLLLGFALVGVFLSLRANAQHPLALFDDYFTLAPEFMAPRLIIRYAQVREAALSALPKGERILFTLETTQGPTKIVWSLDSLQKNDRQKAVDELGLALIDHGALLR